MEKNWWTMEIKTTSSKIEVNKADAVYLNLI